MKASSPLRGRIVPDNEAILDFAMIGLGILGATIIGLVVLGAVSCSMEEAAQILGTRSQTPVFLNCKAVSTQELQFRFSQPVRVRSFAADPPLPVATIEDGEVVRISLSQAVPGGEVYTADILVEDEGGNTLNVLIPFRSRNDRMPRLLINELRTEYSSPRSELVEFKTVEGGNLGGLRLFIAGNTKKPLTFEFPLAETAAGEYIVLHLRTLSTDTGAQNETGDNLGLSGGNGAKAGARDFWLPGSEKLLHKTDAVYLLDQDDGVMDAVMLSETPDPWWTKDNFVQAADMLYQQGAWTSAGGKIPGPVDAVNAGSASPTRTICRDEAVADNNTPTGWYITVNSGETPGAQNNPNQYVAP
jgi:hypothetical protein